ncbi:hypothetical protein VNI00_011950 [Paramarasmius palmivorus]|uniref:Uncharacterized protein n=1 Tax=Paramarasmius palmivorus TaxID=297713 RepID=A0AAW0C8S9_9AGAR
MQALFRIARPFPIERKLSESKDTPCHCTVLSALINTDTTFAAKKVRDHPEQEGAIKRNIDTLESPEKSELSPYPSLPDHTQAAEPSFSKDYQHDGKNANNWTLPDRDANSPSELVFRSHVGGRAAAKASKSLRKKPAAYFCPIEGCESDGFTEKHNLTS